MRVIAGSAKGRKLTSLSGEKTRPTLDRVREAVFGSLQFRLENAKVLDLFAGSGAMGIEAISRGARTCTFCDNDKAATEVIKRNLAALGFEGKVLNADWRAALPGTFDIIIIDPPYKSGVYEMVLAAILENKTLARGGVIIAEHEEDFSIPGGLIAEAEKKYGRVRITRILHD